MCHDHSSKASQAATSSTPSNIHLHFDSELVLSKRKKFNSKLRRKSVDVNLGHGRFEDCRAHPVAVELMQFGLVQACTDLHRLLPVAAIWISQFASFPTLCGLVDPPGGTSVGVGLRVQHPPKSARTL